MKCSNEKCNNNPLDSINPILITQDGDFVCDEHCRQEYEKQKNEFFDNIGNDEWYNSYMGLE